ncbi:MAG: sigma-70 family RNA polymerase sigma factor [Anaerolineae bacterium]|nr:sigma-70 family RNA polymerase sigma factor [Anaerolineae bacterium]
MDDQQAVARLRRGDMKGLTALIQCYQVRAVRTAYLITQDAALAEDVVQDAFIQLYRSIHSFDVSRPFAPWFMRIVVNAAIKASRASSKTVSLNLIDDETDADDYAFPIPEAADSVELAQTEAVIWQALAALSAEQRAVIVLKFYLALSEQEMADQLTIPVGTVKSRLHHAKRQLHHLLADRMKQGEI